MSSTPPSPIRSNSRPPRRAGWALLASLLLCLGIAGCATGSRERARTAEQAENYDQAVVEYTRALQERPGDRELQRDLERAKLRSALHHYSQGRRQGSLGNYDEALLEYQIAIEMNPESGEIQDALRNMRHTVQTRLIARAEGQTELEALVERTRTLPPVGLELPESVLPDSLVFRESSTR
ncbi:MAG: hypothetical protein QF681_17470, partial [Vicinamibacterales bacterium]|nr:hypothetical protein [Vicinamibacterales bacterium]